TEIRQPVHVQDKTIIKAVQDSRAPRRESQHGWPAYAAMCNQHRPALAQLGAGYRYFNIRNRDAGERMEPRCGNMQRKERRHRRDDGMSERLCYPSAADRARTSSGEQEPVAIDYSSIAQAKFEGVLFANPRLLNSLAREESNTCRLGFVEQTIDNRSRRIRHRKYASIRFRLE